MKSLLYVSVLLIFGACTHESGHARGELEVQEIEETATIPQIVVVDRIEEVQATLAYADGVDGSEDKVVSKCLSCQLHMNGDHHYAVHVEGYEVQLCSDSCQKAFSDDPAGITLAIASNAPVENEETVVQ